MPKSYYPYWCRFNHADAYLIWYTHEHASQFEYDGVLLDERGCFLVFKSLADLQTHAAQQNLAIKDEIDLAPLDLDCVERWVHTAKKSTVDCKTFLSAWNLFSDFGSTLQGSVAHIDDQQEDKIYDKLFWGSNLPAMTPPGKYYEPIWTKSEVGRLRNILGRGLRLLRERLPDAKQKAGD